MGSTPVDILPPRRYHTSIMVSDRFQRRIDRILDQIEDAADRRDWAAVSQGAQDLLIFDPENVDALNFLAAAQRALGEEAVSPNAASVDAAHCNFHESLGKSLRGLELARRLDNPRAELVVQQWAALSRLLTGDLQGAKPHLESMRDLAKRLRDRNWLANAFFSSAMASMYEGEWGAARHFSDEGLAVLSMDPRCLASRMYLEFELGEFDQGEANLERLIEVMRLTPPGPNFGYMLPAPGIPLAARVSGSDRHFEAAEAAADAVLTAPNFSTLVAWGARVAQLLGFITSPDTLLRLQRLEKFPASSPRAFGVDEFALRKGRTYGTRVVDLERYRPVDLFEGINAQTMSTSYRPRDASS